MKVQIKSAKDVLFDAICRTADRKGRTHLNHDQLSAMLVSNTDGPNTGAIGNHATTHELFSLQKAGLITFREVAQNTSTKTLTHIALTKQGQTRCRQHTLAVKEHTHNYRGMGDDR